MYLQRPEEAAPASRFADWLELLAASQPERAFAGGELQKTLRLETEVRPNRHRFDAEVNEVEETEITEQGNAQIIQDVFVELLRRKELLGPEYPFVVEATSSGLTQRNRLKWDEEASNRGGALAYLYCLIISARRKTIVELTNDDKDRKTENGDKFHSEYLYGLLLQICASIALGGYLRGNVVSFGFPRADHSSFLKAHHKTWKLFGAYEPVTDVPLGAPDNENDAGIDLVGWMSFPDTSASKILVLGQVASGENWIAKSVVDCANALTTWFKSPSYKHYIPAMVMPFNVTDARKTIARGIGDLRGKIFENEERIFGIVLDRDRVSACVAQALSFSQKERDCIEGIERFDEVASWVRAAIVDLRDAS